MVRAASVVLSSILAVVCGISGAARADVEASPAPQGEGDEGSTVRWRREWPKVGVAELALGGAAVAGSLLVRFVPEPPPRRFHGGLLFDDGVRDALRVSTAQGRRTTGLVSDVLWYTSMGVPLLVEPLLIALAVHGSAEVAVQLIWIAFETLALSAFLATATEHIGRERPRAQLCDGGPDEDTYCTGGEANRSFMSGHTLASFAGAGLMCATHERLPLYGGGAGEVVACAGGLAVATATGVMRIASDNHWATDVLVSGGLGFALGYLLPKVLHFGFGGGGARTEARLVPLYGDGLTGLALAL